jgi:lipopolysaccharide transport system ATP-binding protein
MNDEVVIRVENIGKLYRIGEREPYKTLRDSLTRSFHRALSRSRQHSGAPDGGQYIWALKDVSFEVSKEQVVGIIGSNGAGKSTLLKILSRITQPTEGNARIFGRVGSLLEVGTGFHPELTGRENVYLSGAILGMKKQEIDRKFDEIVGFAGVGKFIDTPLKYYSSGMQVRLGFAVAAHLEPEILLVDEVLAVGDTAFQKKCLGKIGEITKEGRTVLFVSHNMAAVQNLCQRCILFENGRISAQGDTTEVITTYLASSSRFGLSDLRSRKDRKGNGLIRFESVSFHIKDGEKAPVFLSGQDSLIKLRYYMTQELSPDATVLVSISIQDIVGDTLFLCSNELTAEIQHNWPKNGEVICTIPRLPIPRGSYRINIYTAVNGVIADWVTDAAVFEVENSDYYGTGRVPPPSHNRFLVLHSWSIKKAESFQ